MRSTTPSACTLPPGCGRVVHTTTVCGNGWDGPTCVTCWCRWVDCGEGWGGWYDAAGPEAAVMEPVCPAAEPASPFDCSSPSASSTTGELPWRQALHLRALPRPPAVHPGKLQQWALACQGRLLPVPRLLWGSRAHQDWGRRCINLPSPLTRLSSSPAHANLAADRLAATRSSRSHHRTPRV